MRQASDYSPTEMGFRTHSFLKLTHPRDTAKHVSADTGITLSTIEKMLERRSAPGVAAWPFFVMAYGVGFLRAVLPAQPQWLDDAFQAERLAQIRADHERLGREIEALTR